MTTPTDLGPDLMPGYPNLSLLEPLPAQSATECDNQLLQSLGDVGWSAIEPCLERTDLAVGAVLQERGARPTHIVFPIAGAISLEAAAGGQHMQVALVGREGMVGTSLLLGGDAPTRAVVQFAGAAWRAPAEAFAERLAQDAALHRQMLRGVNAFIAQLALTALANAQGTIEQRLARWLLTAAERLDTDLLAITHETLAQALGVRRAGVTVALHVLEGKHALRSERRRIHLLDREQLVAAAGPYRPQKT